MHGFMYSADEDGRGHLMFFVIFCYFNFFFACIYLRAQLERDPESDRLGPPPLPPTCTYINKNIHYCRSTCLFNDPPISIESNRIVLKLPVLVLIHPVGICV